MGWSTAEGTLLRSAVNGDRFWRLLCSGARRPPASTLSRLPGLLASSPRGALCSFWLSRPTAQVQAVGTQLVGSRTWWLSQLCSVGSMTKLNHTRGSVLCQKIIFLEREEFMWFYQAACPSPIWLCAVACVSTEMADTSSCSLRVIAHKTNDAFICFMGIK